MRLLMVAPPGAGKGTQALRIAAHYDIAHLSSGEMFRREIQAGTVIGKMAADYLARGDLLPDNVVMQVLQAPVLEAARNGGFVLDGFPRTLAQAKEAYEWALEVDVVLQAVVHLQVGREELRRRLLARAQTEGRGDDNVAVIEHRLDVYDTETQPLLGYYAGRGLVVDVNGEQEVDKVFSDIVSSIDGLRAARR